MNVETAAPPRPLTAVLEAIHAGAASLHEVGGRTGLAPDVVSAAIEHLVRLGRLSTETLTSGCPDDGCGGCGLARPGGPGCPSRGRPTSGQGPVLVTLRRRT